MHESEALTRRVRGLADRRDGHFASNTDIGKYSSATTRAEPNNALLQQCAAGPCSKRQTHWLVNDGVCTSSTNAALLSQALCLQTKMVAGLRSGIQELLIRKPLVQSIRGSASFLVFSSSQDSGEFRRGEARKAPSEWIAGLSHGIPGRPAGCSSGDGRSATSGVRFHSSPPKVGTGAGPHPLGDLGA